MSPIHLEHCPACTCALGHRPPPNRCPDCGFAYDENTRVWTSSESWARLALTYTTIGLTIGVVVSVLYRLSFDRVPNPPLALLLSLGAPLLGLLFRRVIGGRITGRFVALTPPGIVIGTRTQPVLVPWSDFERLNERRGIPRIQQKSTSTLIAIDDIFANAAEVAAFRDELAQAAKRQRAARASSGAPTKSDKSPPARE